MFRKKTVFILGAGASWHYGYPTGEELVSEVRKKGSKLAAFLDRHKGSITNTPQFLEHDYISKSSNTKEAWDKARQDVSDLVERLQAVDPLVIDYFLGHNRHVADLGKMLIAWTILERESQFEKVGNINLGPKRSEVKDNWYRFLIHRLSSGCQTSADLLTNRVQFVTFNYDVSLEHQLRKGLKAIRLFEDAETTTFLNDERRFLHVYGRIRESTIPHKKINFEPATGETADWQTLLDAAYQSSKGIQIIDPDDKLNESGTLTEARQAIYAAEYVYILGFGFDPKNCERLELPTGLRPNQKQSAKRVMFTNRDNINRVNKSASRVFGTPVVAPGLLNYPGSGDSLYEKSTRNCYDALAMDFDELENFS